MMKFIYAFYICCIWGTFEFSTAVEMNEDEYANGEEIGGDFEGDMILSDEQMLIVKGVHRNVLSGEKYRWPNKTVLYRIFPQNFTKKQIGNIRRAMNIIEGVSCLRFVKANKYATAFVRIVAEKRGCSSTTGYRETGQVMNLDPRKCSGIGTIMHELLHTLGFFHMQSANDRDKYVTIVGANIMPKHEHNFIKYNSSYVTGMNVKYDYDSLMHYRDKAFSGNGKRTIIPKDPKAKIGQRDHLSLGDIRKLNRMYQCK